MSVLSHTLDKVRYFRNLLVTEDVTRVRILIGHISHPLNLAIRDMKGVPVNQLVILREHTSAKLIESEQVTNRDPILVYARLTHDAFANRLMAEYGDCEVIVFEMDPTLSS